MHVGSSCEGLLLSLFSHTTWFTKLLGKVATARCVHAVSGTEGDCCSCFLTRQLTVIYFDYSLNSTFQSMETRSRTDAPGRASDAGLFTQTTRSGCRRGIPITTTGDATATATLGLRHRVRHITTTRTARDHGRDRDHHVVLVLLVPTGVAAARRRVID